MKWTLSAIALAVLSAVVMAEGTLTVAGSAQAGGTAAATGAAQAPAIK